MGSSPDFSIVAFSIHPLGQVLMRDCIIPVILNWAWSGIQILRCNSSNSDSDWEFV